MSCRKDAVDTAFGARGLCCERLVFVGVDNAESQIPLTWWLLGTNGCMLAQR